MQIRIVKSSQVWKACKIQQLECKLHLLRQRRLRGLKRLERLVEDMTETTEQLRKLKEEVEWTVKTSSSGQTPTSATPTS